MENNNINNKKKFSIGKIILIFFLIITIVSGVFGILCGGTFLVYIIAESYQNLSLRYIVILLIVVTFFYFLKYSFKLLNYIKNK